MQSHSYGSEVLDLSVAKKLKLAHENWKEAEKTLQCASALNCTQRSNSLTKPCSRKREELHSRKNNFYDDKTRFDFEKVHARANEKRIVPHCYCKRLTERNRSYCAENLIRLKEKKNLLHLPKLLFLHNNSVIPSTDKRMR